MSQKIRTFVAVQADAAVSDRASDLIEKLRASEADVKWVEPEHLHLTLKFLGDIDITDTYEVCRAVQQAAAGMESFDLEIRGAGAFPNLARPRTIWLGGGEGQDLMAALAERVDAELSKVGYRKEPRRFQTHLTLGRVRQGGPALAALTQMLRDYADVHVGRIAVDEVIIFSSTLTRTGPIYDPLGRAPLGG